MTAVLNTVRIGLLAVAIIAGYAVRDMPGAGASGAGHDVAAVVLPDPTGSGQS